jgi:hypothetical protein
VDEPQRYSLEVVSAMLQDPAQLRTPGPLVLVIDGVDDFNDGVDKVSVEVLPHRFPGRLTVVYTCGTAVVLIGCVDWLIRADDHQSAEDGEGTDTKLRAADEVWMVII